MQVRLLVLATFVFILPYVICLQYPDGYLEAQKKTEKEEGKKGKKRSRGKYNYHLCDIIVVSAEKITALNCEWNEKVLKRYKTKPFLIATTLVVTSVYSADGRVVRASASGAVDSALIPGRICMFCTQELAYSICLSSRTLLLTSCH